MYKIFYMYVNYLIFLFRHFLDPLKVKNENTRDYMWKINSNFI